MDTAAAGMNSAAAGMNNAADGINNAARIYHSAAGITSQTSSSITDSLIPALQNAGTQFSQVGDQVSSILTGYGQQTTEALTDANTKIGTAGQTMTNLAAQLQAIQATASEDGTISAAALNDVINALNSVAGGMTGVDGSYMSSYSDQVSQLAAGVSGQLSSTQENLNTVASKLNEAASGLTQISGGLTQVPAHFLRVQQP